MNVVFDLGGVLLTWNPTGIAASAFDVPHEQALALEQVFGHPDWVELDRGTLPVAEAVERAARRTGLDNSKLAVLFDAVPRFLQPMRPSFDLVCAVREAGHQLFVLSNLHRTSLAHVDSAYRIFDLFDGRVVSCEVGACKPEPPIYEFLLDSFRLDPSQTVFIDDVQANLDAAAAFGIRTVRFAHVRQCRAELRRLGCI